MSDVALRAITVKQPWAWAIRWGIKGVENRSQSTRHLGPLVIHAGLDWSERGEWSPLVRSSWIAWARTIPLYPQPGVETGSPGLLTRNNLWLDMGAVIAVVDLVDCHEATPVTRLDGSNGVCCEPWGELSYTRGRRNWHWVLENAVRLPHAIPCRGRLGLWTLPDEVASKVVAR